MRNFLKAVFFLFLIVLFGYALLFGCLNSPSFTAFVFHKAVVEKHNVRCSSFKVGSQDYSLNGLLRLNNIAFVCSAGEDTYRGLIGELTLNSLPRLILSGAPVAVHAGGMEVQSKAVHWQNAALNAQWQRVESWQGTFQAPELGVGGFKMRNFRTQLGSQNRPRLEVTNMHADFYDGQLSGEILLAYRPELPYHMNLEIKRANLDLLGEDQKALFGALHGTMNMTLDMRADKEQIRQLKGDLTLSPGSTVNAGLASFLLAYLPKTSSQHAALSALVAKGGLLFLDDTSFRFENLNTEALRGGLNVKSKELNLNANVTVDLNVEGGMHNLLNLLDKLKKRNP